MLLKHGRNSDIRATDFFCGAGGSSQGLDLIPGVTVSTAANHWKIAIESHRRNFPDVRHIEGDIRDLDISKLPYGDIFWASPECPQWSKARGRRKDFDNTAQETIDFEEDLGPVTNEEAERSRALMVNVPDYLEAMIAKGTPVKAGVVENVTDCRDWDRWDWWIGRIIRAGYKVKVIALNSMHARPVRAPLPPQSRNRLYVAYWLESLGRDPDWVKWLNPLGYCPDCDEQVTLMQVFKDPRKDMGVYGVDQGQYVYRCPRKSCRNRIVEPPVLPALAAIDWSIPGTPIGARKKTEKKPEGLAPATIARIRAGLARYALTPLVTPCGGGWNEDASPVTAPMRTRLTRESDGLAALPLLVPCEGREGKVASNVLRPMRTQTVRNETGLAWIPFIAELRGGASDARSVMEALATVTASGNHHGLVTPAGLNALLMRNNKGGAEMSTPVTEPMRTLTTSGHQSLITWDHLLVPYNGNGNAQPVTDPIGTVTAADRWSLASDINTIDIAEVLFRMLEPAEIGRAMAFAEGYVVVGNKRQKVRQYGNAVTSNVSEIIGSALMEAITGEPLDRDLALAA